MADSTAPPPTASNNKPAVLIIGGLGYVGRFLALHIHKNDLASEVRLVDKLLPELAWLAPEFAEACSRDRFLQADASREQNMPRIFDRACGAQFDYVFNCGGETRYSQDDQVYRARSHALSLTVGAEAARRRIPVFVELSTGMVYKPDPVPRKESAKLKPWLRLAKWKLQAEEDLAKIGADGAGEGDGGASAGDGGEGDAGKGAGKGAAAAAAAAARARLNLCVLRLAHVYGAYTHNFLGTALCLARVYQSEGREMKWLWNEDLRTNTVHVEDVAGAMWACAEWYVRTPADKRDKVTTFNIVDQGNSSQGTMAKIIHDIFNIPTVFQGTLISQFAKMHLDSVVDDLNDETLDPWADLQVASGTKTSTPLNPFMEKELLKDTDLSLDGSAFIRETGFQYQHPKLTIEEVEAVIESYRRMNWWP